MACCMMAPSHYLNQCWLIISEVKCHSSEGKISLKITNSKFYSNIPGANELKNYTTYKYTFMFFQSTQSVRDSGWKILISAKIFSTIPPKYCIQIINYFWKTNDSCSCFPRMIMTTMFIYSFSFDTTFIQFFFHFHHSFIHKLCFFDLTSKNILRNTRKYAVSALCLDSTRPSANTTLINTNRNV